MKKFAFLLSLIAFFGFATLTSCNTQAVEDEGSVEEAIEEGMEEAEEEAVVEEEHTEDHGEDHNEEEGAH